MVQQGTRLFRWRSYLPLALLPIGIAAIGESGILDRWLGEFGEELWV
ncbi:MAG TPA: lipid A phosphate methyltransferase, partial [Alphaproteobacteria bacterium]|nr:lipid A phosphate methyltransferase [Alphaproteobacteria bacterium]